MYLLYLTIPCARNLLCLRVLAVACAFILACVFQSAERKPRRWHSRKTAPKLKSARTKKCCRQWPKAGWRPLSSKMIKYMASSTFPSALAHNCCPFLREPLIPFQLSAYQIFILSLVVSFRVLLHHFLSDCFVYFVPNLVLSRYGSMCCPQHFQVRRHCAVAACQEWSFRNGPRVSCTGGP